MQAEILPLKSVTLERIEEMERQAAQRSETMAAQERERAAKEGSSPRRDPPARPSSRARSSTQLAPPSLKYQ